MALRIHMANRPQLDNDGFAHGVLTSVAVEETNEKHDWESLRWEFESKGTVRPIPFRVWTGLQLNQADDKGEYNKLTLVCLRLGAVSQEVLDAGQEPEDLDLEALVGLCVRFKLVKEKGLYRIELDSLELEPEQTTLL